MHGVSRLEQKPEPSNKTLRIRFWDTMELWGFSLEISGRSMLSVVSFLCAKQSARPFEGAICMAITHFQAMITITAGLFI